MTRRINPAGFCCKTHFRTVTLSEAFCCSMNPVDWTRYLLPGNGDLRSQQDREMGFCELNQIRHRCQKPAAHI